MPTGVCAKESVTGVYRPRRPQSSPLYQLLEDHFERFLSVYEEEYESRYGPLRSVVKRAVFRFLQCGILEYGFARVVCENCRAEFLAAFSCKTRLLCPSCQAKRLTLWSQWLGEHLLAKVPHMMIILTVPKRLRSFFLWDRKLLGLLARCAARMIKIFYRFLPPVDIAELFRCVVLRALAGKELISESVERRCRAGLIVAFTSTWGRSSTRMKENFWQKLPATVHGPLFPSRVFAITSPSSHPSMKTLSEQPAPRKKPLTPCART